MKRMPLRRSSTISRITGANGRWRGLCPSVRHTEQNEQCLGHPRVVCTDPHMYLPSGRRSPPRLRKLVRLQPPSLVNPLDPAVHAITQRLTPGHIAIAAHHSIRRAILKRLLRVQRCMHAAKHHPSPTFVRDAPHFISAQRIQRMYPNPHNIARPDRFRIERLQCLVHDPWIAKLLRRRRRKHKQPARRDHRNPKRTVTRINQMNRHENPSFICCSPPAPRTAGTHRHAHKCLHRQHKGSNQI